MKKFAAILAVAVLIAFAAPVLAATNPFMDVPMNSWAYDAVAQLASKGILSGYPDGLYKGRQPMTRYEAASVIARALAYVDMTKASKQDVDMLKRLIIEFKDELDALGVRVDALEKDMNLFKRRLGGWRISGRLRMDVDFRARDDSMTGPTEGTSMGNLGLGDARVNVDRFFGEDEKAFFRLQMRGRNATSHNGDREWMYHYFYAKIPFAFDSFLSVGWTGDELIDMRFGFVPDMNGRYYTGGWFNDTRKPMIMLDKSFELGSFKGWISHPDVSYDGVGNVGNAWEIVANFNFRWNEQFGFGIGGQYLIQDDWRDSTTRGDLWDNAFTGWLGVDFNFTDSVALHGIIYFQSKSGADPDWDDSGNAWRLALDINQDLLGFTSFYAEYGRVGESFWAMEGVAHNMFVLGDRDPYGETFGVFGRRIAYDDISFWKVGAAQKWNDKVRTWLYYISASTTAPGGGGLNVDAGMRQYGVGIDYAYNPYTVFSFNYMRWDGVDEYEDYSYSRVRFTTQISF
ncbi:MAG: S-layer homology domain-containing protein [Synergistaceae bacterium]|nr:S-layer homology domain-containing protein [Synergistaceae bacterium]